VAAGDGEGERPCGAAAAAAVVIAGAGVSAELLLCGRHQDEVAALPNVVAGPDHLLVMKWS
jgi:hypothetical protein